MPQPRKGKTVKEFLISDGKEPLQFKVGTDVFTCIPPCDLPAYALVIYAETVAVGRLLAAHIKLFEDVLEPDSYKIFSDRLQSKTSPITFPTMVEISNWLVQDVYAGKAKGLL